MLLSEMEQVHEALESTALNTDNAYIAKRSTVKKREILNHRDTIMRFLEELDAEMSIGELREALEHYD